MVAERTVDIPEGVQVEIDKNMVVIRGPKGELTREFKYPAINMEVNENKIKIATKHERRRTLAVLGTWAALMRNMIKGVSVGYEAKLKIVYSHFPVKFAVQGDKIVIQNFLGEKNPRTVEIIPGTEVKADKDIVTVTGNDKEKVGQTAANIETVCKVRGLDRRVFQDGCFITSKPKELEA